MVTFINIDQSSEVTCYFGVTQSLKTMKLGWMTNFWTGNLINNSLIIQAYKLIMSIMSIMLKV